MADETPVKRGPGRPRKIQVEAQVEVKPEAAVEPKKPEVKTDPTDPRIGQTVDDDRWAHISFSDGEYRVENGVIVEKIG
jgi:hypothetical protein